MPRLAIGLTGILAAAALVAPAVPAAAQPPAGQVRTAADRSHPDEMISPQERQRRALRDEALRRVLDGTASPTQRGGSAVVDLGRSRSGRHKYVEVGTQRVDQLFVLPVEFGNERHPDFPDKDSDPNTPGPTEFDGPLHNRIREPDRKIDQFKIWRPDHDRKYYQDLVFGRTNSMKAFYEKASSGRYSITGEVTDWVKLKYNEARYGRNICGGRFCQNSWALVSDGLAGWVEQQKAAGKTPEQIRAHLARYDQWDRYDFDGDGNFNEADGYLDHLLLVHAGEDESAGNNPQGEDAVWAHRGMAYSGLKAGPAGNPSGGAEAPGTGIWAKDYTVQPENGGLGVFAHEYGHDLGLPDHYDTTGKGHNSVGFWSLMSMAGYLSTAPDQPGTAAGDLHAWDKFQLGWLDYTTARAGDSMTVDLGPAEYNTKLPQALFVQQPKKSRTFELTRPVEGSRAWWSSMGDNLNTTLTRSVAIPAGKPAELAFRTWYEIEDCGCDYAFLEVDAGDGKGFSPIRTSVSKDASEGYGIAGATEGWVDAKADLSAYAGKTVQLRFRYATDLGLPLRGLMLDTLALTSGKDVVFRDNAENGDSGWTAKGFRTTAGTESTGEHTPYYLVENRGYRGPGATLRSGPYNWVKWDPPTALLERYSYLPGLLISQWDPTWMDSNVSDHPGEGRLLPIDTNPKALTLADGKTPLGALIQLYDAPLRLTAGKPFTLHVKGAATQIPGAPKIVEFNDHTGTYFDPLSPESGVKVRDTNTRIVLKSASGQTLRVVLSPAR